MTIRSLLAVTTLILTMCEICACGGELGGDVDAEAGFDVNAHWGECCYEYKGPFPSCIDLDGSLIAPLTSPSIVLHTNIAA